ncbi:MAG: TrkH family potassium uptake protein, partial [Clostridia bacterium]|nr:TrkH family potassium uptake protein [Clostridia bacterium]
MNYRKVWQSLGLVLLVEAGLILFPMLVCAYYGEDAMPFLYTFLLMAGVGTALSLIRPKSHHFYAREGFCIVSLAWVSMSLLGCLPFIFSRTIPNFVDAFFETASGFSTTGASILEKVQWMPKSILFWRSFTHWIGGMGVLVFLMALLPMSNDRSMHVMRAEMPGPVVGKVVPRARDSAVWMYGIYSGLTVLEMIFLIAGGMPLFDSVVNSLATAGTGGFSVLDSGIGGYHSNYAFIVITVFMMLFGVNFNVYFLLLMRKFKGALKSEELWVYFGMFALAVGVISIDVLPMYASYGESVRDAAFQVGATMTTTGFGIADTDLWPSLSKGIILFLMVIGACGGSTGGGMKVARLIILFKRLKRDLKRMLHPRTVQPLKLESKKLDDDTVDAVSGFFIMYMLIVVVVTMLISLDGYSFETNFSATIS